MKNPPYIKNVTRLAAILTFFVSAFTAKTQTQVFFEDWEVDHSSDGTYVTNDTPSCVNLTDPYFDYSTAGIPLSPHSASSSTRALKMCANLVGGIFGGVSVSPVGFGITENFDMRFDMWYNFNGPLPGGGSGTTQVGGAGYGTAGTNAQTAGVGDSVWIGATMDGGSAADFRVYSPAHLISYQSGSYRIGSSGTDASILGDPSSGFVYAGNAGGRANDTGGLTTGYYATNFPGQTVPAAQYALYPQQTNSSGIPPGAPGTANNGVLAFKWHEVSLRKIGNTITYSVDGVLIATVDVVDAGTLGGTNILFNHYDTSAGSSTDPNKTNLCFTLIDNVRITNFPNVVVVYNTNAPSTTEAVSPTPGVFTIVRTSSGVPITVNYTLSGSAVNGIDYTNLSGSVTFSATALSTNVYVHPIDDTEAELTETVVLDIYPSPNYIGGGSAAIAIIDNEPAMLTLTNVSTQMYERTNDYAKFLITRLGDTNTTFNVNLAFAGTATPGVDYYQDATVTFDPGVQTTNFSIYPIADASYEGDETVTASIAAAGGGEYSIGTPNSASINLVDANTPTETVLFSENFNADHSANWTQFFVANDGTPDSNVDFNFDYTSFGIPAAPHGGGNGLFLNVNKDATGSAAALNFYPNGQNFSGNFALRFDMFLSVPLPNDSATEYALAGINHSGTKTNWWRSGGVPAGGTFDGLFCAIETDNSASPNYALYSSPITGANNPTQLASQTGTAMASAFKLPPWGVLGTPGNVNNPSGVFGTPIWADVETSQIGQIVTLKINHSTIFSYTNATAHVSGNILLGYEDAFDSVSPGQSYMVIDNVRVISLASPVITAITIVGANVQVDFTANAGDVVGQFVLQSASSVSGPYTDIGSTITSPSAGNFRATTAYNPMNTPTFYRVRRAY